MTTFAKEYEQYIISGFREETLNSLVNGSQPQKYLDFMRRLNQVTNQMPEDLTQDLYKFLDEINGEDNLRLRLIYLLKKYDLEKTSASEKEEIIEEFKNYFIFDNYNFNKPSHYNQQQEQLDDTQKFSSVLDDQVFKFDQIFNCLYDKNIQQIENVLNKELNKDILHLYIDFNKFSDDLLLEIINKDLDSLRICLTKIFQVNNQDELIKKLVRLAGRPDIQNFYNFQNFLNNLHYYMTTKQIENYIELLPYNINKDNLINELVTRKFSLRLSKVKDNLEKRKILFEINDYLKDKSLTFNSMKSDTILLILENGILVNQMDKKIFLEYLENPIIVETTQYKFSQEKQNKIITWSNNRQNICNMSFKSNTEEKNIVSQYLRHFFLYEDANIKEFSEYLQNNFLMTEFCVAQVLKGVEDENKIHFLTNKVYEDLVNKSEITICQFNKEKFLIDELVELYLDIKNVSTFFVKIFEINTENYYYNKKQALSSAISLEGLIASYEDTYSFSEKPQKLIRRTFNFNQIPNRRGIYVIEMIGNGLSSRALIKKGGLSIVHKSTVNGKILYVLDENQNICKGNQTGVWIKDQFYKSDLNSGAIIVPYQTTATNENIILLHENFAEIANLYLENENYRLEGSFILNRESIILANMTKVLIRPYLYINNRLADLNNLKNPKITINLTKIENDQIIPITTSIEGESLKNKINNEKEIEFEFQVPPKLKSINITLQAEVRNKSQETTNALQFSKMIEVDNSNLYKNKYAKIFFTRNGEDYVLQVLGKNGEAKPNVQISINFTHSVMQIKNPVILQTNNLGEINLGRLPGVIFISANGNYRGDQICSNIFLNDNFISFPQNLDIVESAELKLPLGNNKQILNELYLHKLDMNTNKILENCTEKVFINSYDEDSNDKFLSISGLNEGIYKLGLNLLKTEIIINVHKGRYWENENFIITDNEIIENSEYSKPVHLERFKYINNETINLKLNQNSLNPRVHLFAYKYLSDVENHSAYSIIKNIDNSRYSNKYSFQNWKNVYLNNRILNEEIQYVFDRKQHERFMGNSLDKPSLLMKRQFIRDTTTLIQDAKIGTNYQDRQMDIMQEQKFREREIFPERKMMMQQQSTDYNRRDSFDYKTLLTQDHLLSVDTFHNFLATSPLILTNLVPDENNEIIINIDLKNYSIVHAIVIDSNSVYEENLYLNNKETLKRDLTMNNPLDPSKEFSELRKSNCILKDNKFIINDITSTKFQIIDSLDKFLTFLNLTPHFNTFKSSWNDISFLLKFNELSHNEKLKKISEFFSHEVNVYLYFKHHDFFLENIKPVIKYKSEKTFIDFFLLNDLVRINEFTIPGRYNTLNAFEQCLLIYCTRKKNPELAKTIAKEMRNQADLNKMSAQEMKRMFNIIMNLKMEEIEELNLGKPQVLSDLADTTNMAYSLGGPPGMSGQDLSSRICYMKTSPNLKMMRKKQVNLFEDYGASRDQIDIMNLKNNLHKENGKSKEYCETHYYKNLSSDFKSLVQTNLFFADLADYWANNNDINLSQNFISNNIILPITTLPQLVFTLAVLDINNRPVSHQFNRLEGRSLEINSKSNIIIFTKEISEASSDIKSTLMIAQAVSRNSNLNNEEKVETYVINEIYRHETIVTNISNKTLSFELLIQTPEGSIPVENSDYTRTVNLELSKFKTTKIDTFFYFPHTGDFIQSPPNASIDGVVVAKNHPMKYQVVESIVKSTHYSLDDVLESGSKKEILEFLNKTEILKIKEISKVYWLLKDIEFYLELVNILRVRGLYDHTVWSFSLYHKEITTAEEYLSNIHLLKTYVGPYANFSLLKVDNTNNFDLMNHKDYHPILNARVHRINLEKNNFILNNEFRETYQEFITYLIGLKEIDSKNYLRLCYYLILQDRIEDANIIFERIKLDSFNENNSLQLQYDYISSYLDFSVGYPEFNKARSICEKYRNFPLIYWRELFEEIEYQLLEYDGKESFDDLENILDEEKKKKHLNKTVASSEPKLSFTIQNKNLQILHSNVNYVLVKFYLIDLEILFSRTPFIKQNSDDFSFVQPNFSQNIKLENSNKENIHSFLIPEEYQNSNLFIEVSSITKKSFDTYFSTSLVVNISEAMGEVKVIDQDLKSITKAYVKCFAKFNDDSVKFYKDGYTDLRGKFNFVSLNTNQLKDIKRFSLFISNDSHGSTIKECGPPTNIEEFVSKEPSNPIVPLSEYDNFQNYRQQVKNVWRENRKNK